MQDTLSKPVKFAWLFGARTDLIFFYGSILFGCLLLAGEQTIVAKSALWAIVLLNAFGAGPFHQGATWFAYFDKDNRAEFGGTFVKRLIYYAGPFVVFSGTIAAMMACPTLAILLFFVWSLQHIVSQNIGILLLYHNHNSDEAVVDKSLEIKTQWLCALSFGLIFFYRGMFESARQELLISAPQVRLTPFTSAVVWLSHLLPVVAAIGLVAVCSIIAYFFKLNRQLQEGKRLNVPALMFWLYSIASLCPLAFLGRTFEEGNLIPSTVHWFQYIALNYVLVKNRFSAAGTESSRAPVSLFFQVCLMAALMVMGTSLLAVAAAQHARLQQLLIGVVMAFGGVHYFLDAFLWRFREKSRREAVLPYLLCEKTVG